MKKYLITQSKDGIGVDYQTIIEAEAEPDFWQCYDIAQANGCEHFTVEELKRDSAGALSLAEVMAY